MGDGQPQGTGLPSGNGLSGIRQHRLVGDWDEGQVRGLWRAMEGESALKRPRPVALTTVCRSLY